MQSCEVTGVESMEVGSSEPTYFALPELSPISSVSTGVPDPLNDSAELLPSALLEHLPLAESAFVSSHLDMAHLAIEMGMEEIDESSVEPLQNTDVTFSPLSDGNPCLTYMPVLGGDFISPVWGQNLLRESFPSDQVTAQSNDIIPTIPHSKPPMQHEVAVAKDDLPPWGVGKTNIHTVWDSWTKPDETLDLAIAKVLKIEKGKAKKESNASPANRMLPNREKPTKASESTSAKSAENLSLLLKSQSGFTLGQYSATHKSTNTRDETVFKCRLCEKVFERRYNLKVHMRRHTGATPYCCPKAGCTQLFRWRSSMRHHMKSQHKMVGPISQMPGSWTNDQVDTCEIPRNQVPFKSLPSSRNGLLRKRGGNAMVTNFSNDVERLDSPVKPQSLVKSTKKSGKQDSLRVSSVEKFKPSKKILKGPTPVQGLKKRKPKNRAAIVKLEEIELSEVPTLAGDS